MNELQLIMRELEALKARVESLMRPSTLPLELQKSLEYVGFPKIDIKSVTSDPSYIDLPYPAKTVNQGVGSTDVLDLPTYWARVDSDTNGPTKWIPVFVKAEF